MANATSAIHGRLYVIGEKEEKAGPVKIGITTGGASQAVAAGLTRGNWRTLEVLYDEPVSVRDLRWREWLIHEHLSPWWIRGEWFDVRKKMKRHGDWPTFLDAAFAGNVRGSKRWRLGNRDHHLVAMHRLTPTAPRQFDAECACSVIVRGDLGQSLTTVLGRYAVEHLKWPRKAEKTKTLFRDHLMYPLRTKPDAP